MSIVTIEPLRSFIAQQAIKTWQERRAEGKALRRKMPRESHAHWKVPKDRPSPIEMLRKNNQGRQEHLIPLRFGRMAASPFAFLRGSACVMAHDLSSTPVSGISTIIDGDAHISNFGMYGTPQREVVFDLNDFDESMIGPWEWDLKRLVASVNVAGRQNGLTRKERAVAVRRAVDGYRFNVRRLQSMAVLDIWYLHAYPGRHNPIVKIDPKAKAVFDKTLTKALHTDNHTLLPKVADYKKNSWTFRENPPVLTRLNKSTREKVIGSLKSYAESLSPERRFMLSRYHVVDAVHRIVGVGSVGTRAYLVLLLGSSEQDPLFLQVKESVTPAHAPFLPRLGGDAMQHNGMRVMIGQRALQASSDPMLGYTDIDGRHFYVRQMKNLKASVPIEWLTGSAFNFYAWACGAILARAHARTSDPARIAGYCGNSSVFDEALAEWAEAYGDQTEQDHATLLKAIRHGTVKADVESVDE